MSGRGLLFGVGLIAFGLAAHDALAEDCMSYDQMKAKLSRRYGEQLVFSGFADSDTNKASNAIFEFWANPSQGNWSLIVQKLMQFQYENVKLTKNCAFIVNTGKQHQVVEAMRYTDGAAAPKDEPPLLPANDYDYNCTPRNQHAQVLKEKHHEVPVVQALTADEEILEIFGSDNSWTITNARIREVRHSLTGAPLTDAKTGQEIHEFCSTPAYSGKTWGLFPATQDNI